MFIIYLRDVLEELLFSSGANLTRDTFCIWVGEVTGDSDSFPLLFSLDVATENTLIHKQGYHEFFIMASWNLLIQQWSQGLTVGGGGG